MSPLNKGKTSYVVYFMKIDEVPKFTLKYFLDFYSQYENKEEFLIREQWVNKLAGTNDLIQQIREGKSENEIVQSWQPELQKYKALRKKYLLYPDFE